MNGALCMLLFTSCSDFLDKEIEGNATDETFYDTRYKMQTALNAAYDVLQSDQYNDQEWRFGEAIADNIIGTDEGMSSQMGQLVNFRFNTSNTWIRSRWEINYKGIHRANQVIANIHRVKIADNAPSTYQGIRYLLAQAKFLRAYYYFNLVKTYGGVPIRPETESVEKLVVPRSTREECYAYIEKDLREAAIMLPAVYPNSADAGRITLGATVGLLMKVIMYQAVPGQPSEKWEQLRQLGAYFIEGEQMKFKDILQFDGSAEEFEALRQRLWFKPANLSNESETVETPESNLTPLKGVYSLEYKDYYNQPLHGGDQWAYVYQWYGDGEFCKASVFEVVFKESADGTNGDTNEGAGIEHFDSGNTVMYCTNDIIAQLFGSDVRKKFIIFHQTTTPDGETWQGGEGRGVSLKWYTPRKDRPKYAGDNGRNRRVMRYPEVVLMYAEGLNECGDREGALTWLNTCKEQVNTINSGTTLYTAGSYGFIRDQIWQERRIEFAFEWDRFFDLVRQHRAASVIKAYGEGRANRRGYFFREGVNELFPIPQNEIDLSNGVVEQNPGY
ncbi:MAG: RagB/SusD family nutrient uptake outer membrane protein [Prevotella sp.]|nr:RagB/SusD family nutrient uptake outer membrane protein [Prevotella sp.]